MTTQPPLLEPRLDLPTHTVQLELEGLEASDLWVRRLQGREKISSLFQFDVQVASRVSGSAENLQGAPVDPDEMIGRDACLRFLDRDGGLLRTVHGLVSSCRMRADAGIVHATYDLTIVPRAWQLGLVSMQEVFLDQTVLQILRTKLSRLDLAHTLDLRTVDDQPSRELVVQYKETDLAFVSRLLEHVGLAFHFEEGEEGGERLVVTDQVPSFPRLDQAIRYAPQREAVGVSELSRERRLIPGEHAVADYNYRNPHLDLVATASLAEGRGGIVEYGTHHKSPEEGRALAAIRAEEATASAEVYEGRSLVARLSAGLRFQLEGFPFGNEQELLVVEVHHELDHSCPAGAEGDAGYRNRFVAVSTARAFRPARTTPRPRIHGVVSAIVQVKTGDTTNSPPRLDAEGRYTISFHFDQVEAQAEKTSHPVRMAQPFAGPQQGMHFPLRQGTEVLVAFVDGDPDRPVIVGAVPNTSTPSVVTALEPYEHRIRSHHGLVIEFGASSSHD